MSSMPIPEAILLEIYQSLGGEGYQTKKKIKFATGQLSLKAHKEMGEEVLQAIFDRLDVEPKTREDASSNFMEFANAFKSLELKTWTFAADQRQILWTLLSHFYVPALARRVAFWSLGHLLDKGMSGGQFWYLPQPREVDGKTTLHLPVAQVVDWLLDLLGLPLEKFADQRSESTDGEHEGLRRSLYNWRNATPIRPETIQTYFADTVVLDFKGAFSIDMSRAPDELFADALAFVNRKKLDAGRLRLEIPMTQEGRLEAILNGTADTQEQATFVECLLDRYSAPLPRTIRQRLMLARMMQDGYIRLLNFLSPGTDRQSADFQQNKLLQLVAIYKLVYNLTVDAWRNCRDQGEGAENAWFEKRLLECGPRGLFLSILPSRRKAADHELAHMLTRQFIEMHANDELEDHIGLDEQTARPIIQRSQERAFAFAEEIKSELRLTERLKSSSPWRTLQGESRYWVILQVAQSSDLPPIAKQAAIQRLRDLAVTPSEAVGAIALELGSYLDSERKQRPKDTVSIVQALLAEAEVSDGYEHWKPVIMQYKAKHLLACNDLEGAGKLFRLALEAGLERNFGALRGEVARDCFALEVANRKPNANNHEKYFREMLAGGMFEGSNEMPTLEEAARGVSAYFWNTLYKPYPGFPVEKRRASGLLEGVVEGLMPMLMSGDQGPLQEWIKENRALLNSTLPDVEGNSVLMALIKMRSFFVQNLPLVSRIASTEFMEEAHRFEAMFIHWRQFLGQLAKNCPSQLNIGDLKGQTPLMLMAEDGDTELVKVMLDTGADPEIQDWKGMTALHSACKCRADSCVDVLLDRPCKLDKLTNEDRSPLHTACWAGNVHAVKRLLQLAPGLVWKRDSFGRTPLEWTEWYLENPDALLELADRRAQDGARCASKQELDTIVHLLEQVAPAL